MDINKYKEEMSFKITRVFTLRDAELFSEVSGDKNPIHLNEEYARQTMFGKLVVHGALAASIFSKIFANDLPGPGCIYLKSNLVFIRPIFLNENVSFTVKVKSILRDKRRIIFDCDAKSNEETCISGESQIYIPD